MNNNKLQKITSRVRIIGMRESGNSVSNIARELGLCRNTVAKWIRRWEEEQNLQDHRRSGGPRKTTAEEDYQIKAVVGKNPLTNSCQIVEHLQLNVSPLTVRRRLREQEVNYRTDANAEKEKLTESHRNFRLNFANDFKDEDMDFWARVIFTDEKTFCSHDNGKIYSLGRNIKCAHENIKKDTKIGHVTCNLWGWMHFYGVGELSQIFERITSDQYIEILEEVMLPSVRAMAIPYPERILLMHDTRPIHTSRAVRSWFQEHPEIELLNWPTQSDLNPMENIWSSVVREWEQPEARTTELLKQYTFRVWESLRRKQEIIASYVQSMPHRLQMVLDQEGGWTNY